MKNSQTFKIINKLGLHTRAAALFVKISSRFNAEIMVTKGKQTVNGKSIMGILTLAAACGSRIKIDAEGSDAKEALEKLGELIEQGFNEE